MSNVNQAFIKAYQHRARPSQSVHQPHTARRGVEATGNPLEQAQLSVVVGSWNSAPDTAADDDGSEDDLSGHIVRMDDKHLRKESLRSAAHLPAVLSATAAATERVHHERDLESTGVEYQRPFIRLPRSEHDRDGQGVKSATAPGTGSDESRRATVVFDSQQSAAIPQPHFDVAAVPEHAGESVTAPAPAAPPEEQTKTTAQVPAERDFRPAWEVDSFSWPQTMGRLLAGQPNLFDRLVAHVVQLADKGSRRIAIVGCSEGCGATLLTLCLARRLAEVVERVAVVDGNLGRPGLAKKLDICLQAGWEEVIAGKQVAEEAAIASLASGITLLPLMEAGAAVFDEAAAERAASMIERLVHSHDIVLVDAAPAGTGGQKSVLAEGHEPAADAAILVRDCRRPAESDLAAALEDLRRRGVPVAAVAENFTSAGAAGNSRAAA